MSKPVTTLTSSAISERAQSGLKSLFLRHLEEALITSEHATWTQQSLSGVNEIRAEEFMILTVSSYDLRTFVLLHFSKTPTFVNYVRHALDAKPECVTDEVFYDYMGEVGNRCCGAFKRELGKVLPHLGMSTPNRLPNASLIHLEDMKCGYSNHVRLTASDEIAIYASLYVSTYGEEEFRLVDVPIEESPAETGALELF